MARTRVRTHVVHRKDGSTYTRHYHSRQTRGGQWQRTDAQGRPLRRRRKPKRWFKPKRALRNFRKAARAAKRNRGWSFLAYAGAGSSELLAFTAFRGFGALFAVGGVGLTGLGTWMRQRT